MSSGVPNYGAAMSDRLEEHVDLDALIHRRAGLAEAHDGDAVLLLDRDRWICHLLSPAATVVWESLEAPASARALTDELSEVTGLPRREVQESVVQSVRQLLDIAIASIDEPLPPVNHRPTVESSFLPRPPGRWDSRIRRLLALRAGLEDLGCFEFGSVVVQISSEIASMSEHLRRVLASLALENPGSASSMRTCREVAIIARSGEESLVAIYLDGHRVLDDLTETVAMERLLQELNQLATQSVDDAILLHAGAVERDGHVVVIAGESGSGKSTLTASLVAAGFRYVTDEMTIIEPEGFAVRPYPKALDLDEGSLRLLGMEIPAGFGIEKFQLTPEAIGSCSAGGRMALLVILGDSVGSPVEVVMSPIELLVALLPSVFATTYAAEEGFSDVVRLCQSIRGVRLDRMPIETMIAAVTEQISTISSS